LLTICANNKLYLKDNTVLEFVNTDGSNKIKGTPISFGKVKARVCVAMNLDEAQNIQVFLNLNLVSRKKSYNVFSNFDRVEIF
jgi:hypothetical protein